MGQYYNPCVLHEVQKTNGQTVTRPRAWVYSHAIKVRYKGNDNKFYTTGNGLKLTEHSWIGNRFVEVIEKLLIPGGDWYKQPIVWAGDYADGEKDTVYNYLTTDGAINESRGSNLYDFCDDNNQLITKAGLALPKSFRYILNHDTKQFVDKKKVLAGTGTWAGWKVHPLPLLTCEGNGRGGGDYGNENEFEIVGSWARCRISVEETVPADFTELTFNLPPL